MMFGRMLRKAKDEYFLAMLMECLKNAEFNENSYNIEEMATLLFPKAERDLNVDQAIAQNYPLNAAAMRYYANCMKVQFEGGNLDEDQYVNMISAQFIYLEACKHWEIMEGIARDLLVDGFEDEYRSMIDAAKAAGE